jgi:hypothetical protein
LVLGLIFAVVRLMVFLVMAALWLSWALIADAIVLALSLTGNSGAARSWQRSLRWRRFL